jgi:hypothetical protein
VDNIIDVASSTTPKLYTINSGNLELSTIQGYTALRIKPFSSLLIPVLKQIPAPSSGSILFVYTQNGQTVAGQAIVGWGSGSTTPYGPILTYADSSGKLFAKNGGTTQSFTGTSYNVSSGVPTLVFFGWDTSNFYISVNGNQQIVTTYAETGKSDYFSIGYGGNGTIPNMTIGELLLYTQYLEQSERQILEGYLCWKWGIVRNLSQSHPFKIQAPINGTQKEQFPLDIPSQFESLTTWLDAGDRSTIQLNNTNVISWSDKSSSVDTFVTTATPNVAYSTTQGINSPKLPGVRFSLTGNLVGNVNAPFNKVRSGSCFLVATVATDAPNGVQVMTGALASANIAINDGNSFGFYSSGSNAYAPYQGYNNSNQNRFPSSPANSTFVLFARFDGSDNRLPIQGDGSIDFISPKNNGNNSEVWIPKIPSESPWTLGYTEKMATDQSFFLHEFICLSEYVTDTKRQVLEGYLAWKWGLQSKLPAGHPYSNARPQSM